MGKVNGEDMISDLSSRLRELRDRNGWTVADMAERTGIPKRTLDKYMLRSCASLPGLEAICALSSGLGVSLDWLVFGSEGSSTATGLIVRKASSYAVRLFTETMLREHIAGNHRIISGERILNLTPEQWAIDLGLRAQEEAQSLIASGVTLAELLVWEAAQKERASELFNDMVEQLVPDLDDTARKVLKL
jgi:transcriptional regulator with XRE-family HTH domain